MLDYLAEVTRKRALKNVVSEMPQAQPFSRGMPSLAVLVKDVIEGASNTEEPTSSRKVWRLNKRQLFLVDFFT